MRLSPGKPHRDSIYIPKPPWLLAMVPKDVEAASPTLEQKKY
jgi:hypothetical protein